MHYVCSGFWTIMPMARAYFISAAFQGRINADPAALRGLLLLIRP